MLLNAQATVVVKVLAPDLIRMRMVRGTTLPPDHSYAVLKTDWPKVDAEMGGENDLLVAPITKKEPSKVASVKILEKAPEGWDYADDTSMVWIKVPDPGTALKLEVTPSAWGSSLVGAPLVGARMAALPPTGLPPQLALWAT